MEISEAIKNDVGKILGDALSGQSERYRYDTESGLFIRWGLVQKDINEKIDYHLTKGKTWD